MKYPFEVPFANVESDLDTYVSAVFSTLVSEFLVLPRGEGFIDYSIFEKGYEALKKSTHGFEDLSTETVLATALASPVSMLVLRSILGLTPPEWAYITTQRAGIEVTQGAARSLDRRIRLNPLSPLAADGITGQRIRALVEVAGQVLREGLPQTEARGLHRMDKADTRSGLAGVRALASMGVPYAMLLYERFLGRPFAGHRDSVSELVGDALESAIEDVLSKAGITYRKTKRAERIQGFDQTPDFIVPSEFNPQIIIEAKITEDDGTARDKATRIQHLGELSMKGQRRLPRYEVIACIGGRGFGVRREDMKKMLLATRGKVFTMKTLDRLVECTKLSEFRSNR